MTHTTPRLQHTQLAPKAFQHMLDLTATVKSGALGARLVDLVWLRCSQINGCGFCMDMHWQDLVRAEVQPRHINAVAGWREAPFFSERERAAFHWAELVTSIPQRDPDDEAFAQLSKHFSEVEIAELGFAIATINAWNLMNVSFRKPIPASV
ncbi:carboxymuconolactone decarboxylase family protein [Viridibacterium curvum]|uniref:Carboxymuconolactone decarboxylase family protein n=1 Tax=Viridibacterium curvum TaxID=1101404 RepID=A0ABP9QRX7_9RHOO